MPEAGVNEDAREDIIRRNGWAVALVAVGLGVTFIGSHLESGLRRFAAAAWDAPMSLYGSPASWGAIILIAGVLQVWGRILCVRRKGQNGLNLIHWGCRLAFLWCCFVATGQAVSFYHDTQGHVNAVGFIVWTYLAYMYRERFKLSDKRLY